MKKKEMVAAAAAFSRFPKEIQSEILVKLPAKSVFTCKCVCKLWLNLISSPRFINDHLHLSIQNKKNHKLMFTDKESVTGKPLLYSIDHASISSSPDLSCDYIAEKIVHIDYPFEYKEGMEIRILGACNGLICFGILMDTNSTICIWNPTTREYKEIQHCDFHIDPKQVSTAGFGFDAKTGDYKMVRIGDYEQSDYCKVDVYTFGLHLSKTVLTFAYMYPHEIALRGVFLNGALQWIGSMFNQVNSNSIVSFDISNEKLMDVALPVNSIVHPKDGNSKSFKQVGVLDECLSLVLIDDKMVRAEIWVMQEYGVRESWTKLFTTTLETVSRYPFFFYTPMLSLENGEILIYTCDGFVLCDPKNDRVGQVSSFFQENTIGHRGITMMMAHPESYVESLVSLNSGTYAKKPN